MSIAHRVKTFQVPETDPDGFVDRRPASSRYEEAGIERRQFPNTGGEQTGEGAELSRAIDLFKFKKQKKKITIEELLVVMKSLGYSKS